METSDGDTDVKIPNSDIELNKIESGANLQGVDFSEANLSGLDLQGASFYDTDLSGADLSNADLRRANFTRANLRGAILHSADLRGTNLREADLRDADLEGITVDSTTYFSRLSETEELHKTTQDWSKLAKMYAQISSAFSTAGLKAQARQFQSDEFRAEGLRDKAYLRPDRYIVRLSAYHILNAGLRQVAIVMIVLYVFSTLFYFYNGISNPIYYSIVVFTTSSRATQPPPGILMQLVVMTETFIGTLLIVLLGAKISSRIN